MENVRPEGTEDQYVTSPMGEALGRNVHVRRSEHIRNDSVASIAYMIQDRYLNRNVDTDDIISLLAEWDTEYFMDTPSTFHMREYYALNTQSHDPDTPTYMEALSGEN